MGEAGRPAGGAQPHAARRGFHVTCSNWFAALNHSVQLSLMSVRSFVRRCFCLPRAGSAAPTAHRPQRSRVSVVLLVVRRLSAGRAAASIKKRRRLCNRDFDHLSSIVNVSSAMISACRTALRSIHSSPLTEKGMEKGSLRISRSSEVSLCGASRGRRASVNGSRARHL